MSRIGDMDIENMQAGREMDALVAEKVMVSTDPCSGPMDLVEPHNDGGYIPACKKCSYIGWDEPSHELVIPPYSVDISAAWQVVKVYDPEYNVKLYNHGDGWTFVIYKDATHYEADALTPELAICRAALKSLASKAIAPARAEGV